MIDVQEMPRSHGPPAPRYHNMPNNAIADGRPTRNERNLTSEPCVACEESLLHTLSGERVLQLSCGHAAHQACFEEYTRGTDTCFCPVCDAEHPESEHTTSRDDIPGRDPVAHAHPPDPVREQRSFQPTPTVDTDPLQMFRPATRQSHPLTRPNVSRHGSTMTTDTAVSSTLDSLPHKSHREQSIHMESNGPIGQDYPRSEKSYNYQSVRTPIPHTHTSITVKSEFPTLTRSHQPQTLTCLVTVEVPLGPHDDPEDSHAAESHLSMQHWPRSPPTRRSLDGRWDARDMITPRDPKGITQDVSLNLQGRVDDWHGLDPANFGRLYQHLVVEVSKDQRYWQALNCYLYEHILICVREKGVAARTSDVLHAASPSSKCVLKGSVLVKKHLRHIDADMDNLILSLVLSASELPQFHLRFHDRDDLEVWFQALRTRNASPSIHDMRSDHEWHDRSMSSASSYPERSPVITGSDYALQHHVRDHRKTSAPGTSLDLVIILPIYQDMQNLKLSVVKDTLRYLLETLPETDRMALVICGHDERSTSLASLASRDWTGWQSMIANLEERMDTERDRVSFLGGVRIAIDELERNSASDRLAAIMLVSDIDQSHSRDIEKMAQRARRSHINVYAFGLGLSHQADALVELSSRTMGAYLYVKDWMTLRECVAGCLGALKATRHRSAKLILRVPEDSAVRITKTTGALQTTKRPDGRVAHATLGSLRRGDKRDVIVQLTVEPDSTAVAESTPDQWDAIVASLEALVAPQSGPTQRGKSGQELAVLQAELICANEHGEVSEDAPVTSSLFTIFLTDSHQRPYVNGRPLTPPVPPNSWIVQRRMELLTSDMLSRALAFMEQDQFGHAEHLLRETQSILKGLAKGGLPPLPGPQRKVKKSPSQQHVSPTSPDLTRASTPYNTARPSSAVGSSALTPAFVDPVLVHALDAELQQALEWLDHPTIFERDSRKAILQAIGVISSQQAFTFRSAVEALWADRIPSIKASVDTSKSWHGSPDLRAA